MEKKLNSVHDKVMKIFEAASKDENNKESYIYVDTKTTVVHASVMDDVLFISDLYKGIIKANPELTKEELDKMVTAMFYVNDLFRNHKEKDSE